MNKADAIAAMAVGLKVRHKYFTADEWMTLDNNTIVFEDGCRCSGDQFWRTRQDECWDDGYSIIVEGESNG